MDVDPLHKPVLLDEVLVALNINPDGVYIDATFGRGGHSQAILQHLNERGKLIAIDQDPEAITCAERIFKHDARFEIVHCNFNKVTEMVAERGLNNNIDGVLLDLGVSSPQLDDPARGFSFMRSGPLDMRMNSASGLSAAQWLANVREEDLSHILKKFGEERYARKIARAIVATRKETEINNTTQLAEIVKSARPASKERKHPATRTFQAIRIFINDELQAIEEGLNGAASILKVGGRLAVISFHSLEDRIVKRFMRVKTRAEQLPAELPVVHVDEELPFRLIGKPQVPDEEEIANNTRARSARLRVLEKVH